MGPNHLLWLCFICALCQGHCFHLRVMRLQMSNEEGAGMDGGFLETIGGGDFEMKICTSNEQVTSDRLGHNGGGDTYTMDCCHTGNLNTAVDNWERGQHNFFIGRQLGACEDFRQALFLDTCFDYFSCCYSTPHIGVPAFFPFLFLFNNVCIVNCAKGSNLLLKASTAILDLRTVSNSYETICIFFLITRTIRPMHQISGIRWL